MTLKDLRIEYHDRPQGLGVRRPRFSWKLESDRKDTVQASYRLTVAGPEGVVWDTGVVARDTSVLVPYDGAPLAEDAAYAVTLTVTDNHGDRAVAGTRFTTGVFDPAHFTARMITHDFPPEETACPVFTRRFALSGPVARARLYATAHGIYEASLNGRRVGDAYLTPGWTDYHKIGGINQTEPGYRRFILRPMFVRGIQEADTQLETPYGRIVSRWSCRDGKIRVFVRIPANTRAVLYLPEKPESEALELGSGQYEYEYPTDTDLRALRFTLDSTLGDILAQLLGLALLSQYAPDLVNNPMIEYAKRMTLAEGISSAPQVRPLYEMILKALNAQ